MKNLSLYSIFIIFVKCIVPFNILAEEKIAIEYELLDKPVTDLVLKLCEDINIKDCPKIHYNDPRAVIVARQLEDFEASYSFLDNVIHIVDIEGFFGEKNFFDLDEKTQCAVIGHELGHTYHSHNMNIFDTKEMESKYGVTLQSFADLIGAYLCDYRENKEAFQKFLHHLRNSEKRIEIIENIDYEEFISKILDQYS